MAAERRIVEALMRHLDDAMTIMFEGHLPELALISSINPAAKAFDLPGPRVSSMASILTDGSPTMTKPIMPRPNAECIYTQRRSDDRR